MNAYIFIVIAIAVLALILAMYDWVQTNKQAIMDEAALKRSIKVAVNNGWKERDARMLAPLDQALAHSKATLARVELTTQECVGSTYSIVRNRKDS